MYNPPWCGWNLFEFIRVWIPVYTLPTRVQRSWSARRGELDFPRVNLATYGGRAFVYSGRTSWNCLPDSLNDINLKAKFHYASWFGASSELAPN